MQSLNIVFPAWINGLPKGGQPRAKMRFLLKLAATLATQEGSITALSTRIGLHRNSLNAMLSQGALDNGLPVNIIKSIESVVGTGVIPRDLLNPEIYSEL